MKFFTHKVQGSISLFLVLIMLPMFVLAGLVVDGSRISAARVSVSGAGDLAMSAGLSEYDKILHDVYGLFAMSESMEDLETNMNLYFSNTINNTGILQSSDSYTRSFFNSIGSWFSGGDIEFDNIVDTEVESFNAVAVANSSIANPAVMKRQIVDYMKIRGPVNLGVTLLSKLGCIGETSKQNRAVKAKVKYDKKLKNVQEACETAYNAIVSFHSNVDSSNFSHSDYIGELNTALGTSKEKTRQMIRRIIAAKLDKFQTVKQILSPNYTYNNDTVKPKYEGATVVENDAEATNLNKYTDVLALFNEVMTDDDFNRLQSWPWGVSESRYGSDPLDAEMNMIIEMNNDDIYERDVKIFTIARNDNSTWLTKAYNDLTDDQKNTGGDSSIANFQSKVWGVGNATSGGRLTASGFLAGWKTDASTYGQESCQVLYDDWYSHIEAILTDLSNAIEALNTVKTKVNELQEVKTEWRGKLDDLSDGDIKTSLEGDYNNCAQQINVAVVDALIQVLTNNQTHFTELKTKLDGIKFKNEKIIRSDYASKNYYNLFKGKVDTASSATDVASATTTEMNTNYHGVTNISDGMTQASFRKINETDDQFYRFLVNTCGNNSTDETSKTEAKSQRTQLINKANDSESETATDQARLTTTGNIMAAAGISEELQEAINLLAAAGVTGNTFAATDIQEGSDDDMASNGESNLSSISDLLDGLGSIAMSAAETVYLEEYVTEMFSCYTTGVGDVHPSTLSLNGTDLSPFKFYRSEVEYILWGNDTVEGNIAATVALIFGIRFALDCIFAFTNQNTRSISLSAATAIAGWTGFGVPIVQTVILLAWSLAEAIIDVQQLCIGKDVVIYKTWETWMLGPNGVQSAVKDLAKMAVKSVFDEVAELANSAIDQVAGKIETFATDTIDGVQESVVSTVMTSLQTLVISVVGESNYNLTQADIQQRVDNMLQQIKDSNTGDGPMPSAIRAAVGVLEGQSGTIASKLHGYYEQAKTGAYSKVEDILNDLISESITNNLKSAVTNKLDEAKQKLKDEANRIIAEGGDKVTEELNGAIDDFLGGMGQGGSSGSAGQSSPSAAARITLNYKEYLKIFVLLNMIGNEEKMLNRCAKIMQTNVSKDEPSFDISKAYTMAQINSTVTIRTTFFEVPVSTGVDAGGNPTYDLDFSNIGTGRQRINYVGILGY